MAGDKTKLHDAADYCPLCRKGWEDKDDEGKNHKDKIKNEWECPNKKSSCGAAANGCGRGTNEGNGGKLDTHIEFASKCEKKDHPLAYNGRNLQAHHLICSEAMNDDEGLWVRICQLTGYNINCYKNGVRLPFQLRQACGAKVPLHRGGHGAGYGGKNDEDESFIYPEAVIAEIEDILQYYSKIKACEKPKKLEELVDKLNQKSNKIFKKIKKFEWTITWDGFDYQNGNPIGCSNVNSISAKRRKDKAVQDKLSKNRVNTIEKIEKNREEMFRKFKDLNDDESIKCGCGRKHPIQQYKLLIGK